MPDLAVLAAAFFAVAVLYSAVGNAGGTGYLAVMALFEVAPERMKPTALLLNVLVSTVAVFNFRRAGVFYPRAALPLLVGSVPFAWLGGTVSASGDWYQPLVGALLALAGVKMLTGRGHLGPVRPGERPVAHWAPSLALGAVIGALSGLTGTGGGIFLTPVLVLLGWATIHQSAGISAVFILASSAAALAGSASVGPIVGPETGVLAVVAVAGGFLGSWAGAHRLPERPLTVALGVVLMIGAARLLWPG